MEGVPMMIRTTRDYDLNGSPADYDRDPLCPTLVAVPADSATTAAPKVRPAQAR